MNSARITATGYNPDDELRGLLQELFEKVEIRYDDQSHISLFGQYEAMQRDYTVEFDEFAVEGFETISPLGVFVSLEGHLGLAASFVLANAVTYGEITQVYSDEAPPGNSSDDRYKDLTAEWYKDFAVEAGIPELRFKNRPVAFEAEKLEVAQVEEWARKWLSAGQ